MEPLDQLSYKKIDDLITVNTLAPTMISKFCLRKMTQRDNKSLIITVGSEAGTYPHGDFPIYCATKAYTNHFAKSLNLYLEKVFD